MGNVPRGPRLEKGLAGSLGAALVTAALACAACGGGAAEAHAQGPGLWPYTGDATKIFDDAIELPAVGFGVDRDAQPLEDKRIRERTQIADAVLRVRVPGINTDGANGWLVACHTVEQLAGKRPPPTDFNLQVEASAPAAGLLKQYAALMANGTFIIFLEEFARPDGLPGAQLHFHLAKDTAGEVTTIREAAALGGAP
jgi:hypothetical protein